MNGIVFKLCEAHAGQLKRAIKDRGLWQWVSPTTEEAQRRMDAPGIWTRDTFDPLAGCTFNLAMAAIEDFGFHFFVSHPGCALCVMEEEHRRQYPEHTWTIPDTWIESVTNAAVRTAQKLGLVGKA